ncbi:MAG: hypothetical protein H7Y01_15155 [Ferruginibacter sp.]|nr:hypothetical protein [Chitinophagaceae bacterium]
MLRITSGAFHEKLTAGKEEIILNGTPGDLRGHIFISNKNNDTLKVKSLPIMHGSKTGTMGTENVLRLSCRLNPGEEKMVNLLHQVHPSTPPGTYESTIMVGGENRKVKMVVQQLIKIDIQPSSFTFLGSEPGKTHTSEITLTNLGNIPFQVPDVKHVATLDMDMLCRAFGVAMRKSGSGYEEILNDISKNIQSNLPDWAQASIAENGAVLQPGEKLLIHISITIPKNCDPQNDYNGSMRFWDKVISYVIKSNNSKKK